MSVIPPAETIEGAKDDLAKVDAWVLKDQARELHEAIGDHTMDYASGYALGLQVARRIIQTNVQIILKDIKPTDIL